MHPRSCQQEKDNTSPVIGVYSMQNGKGPALMAPSDDAFLDRATWIDSLARLSDRAGGDAPMENCLRLSRHLCALAPSPFDAIVDREIDEAAFEILLANQAFEAAAIQLIGPSLLHEIVAKPGSLTSARVWSEGHRGEAMASARCPARALVLAWIGFLLSLQPDCAAQATGNSHKSA